jgi:type IV secretion system protein VirD4
MNIRLGFWDKTLSEPLNYPAGEAHGLLCSPTRGGKFRDVIAQILLSFEGSCFVIDPKGQAAAVTARYRRDVLKQDVYLLNPFKILPTYLGRFDHASYDPVASKLDPESDTFASDADNLMEGLMPHGGPEVHWIDSARQLGAGLAMQLRMGADRWSLPDVYASIADRHLYQFCEDEIQRLADDPDVPSDDVVQQIVIRLGRFAGKEAADNREVRSVVSTAITRLGFLGNRHIADNMRKSTVDFAQMKHRPMTVYVILPGRYLAPYSPWLRTITNAWADSCLEEGKGKLPVLGILDEFKTAVGRLGAIDTLNAMGAGYGCQLLTVIQDLNQLKEIYPQSWETFVANSGFQMFFSPRDWTTSDYISRMTGMTDVPQASRSFSPQSMNLSLSTRERRSMLPEEVRGLSENEMLVSLDYAPGFFRAGRRPYYAEDSEFKDRCDIDPYHS